jgi:hypothetical protein
MTETRSRIEAWPRVVLDIVAGADLLVGNFGTINRRRRRVAARNLRQRPHVQSGKVVFVTPSLRNLRLKVWRKRWGVMGVDTRSPASPFQHLGDSLIGQPALGRQPQQSVSA